MLSANRKIEIAKSSPTAECLACRTLGTPHPPIFSAQALVGATIIYVPSSYAASTKYVAARGWVLSVEFNREFKNERHNTKDEGVSKYENDVDRSFAIRTEDR